MEESILLSIKKLLGIEDDDTAFDTDLIININSVFPTLAQLGVGPKDGYEISGENETWSDYLKGNKLLNTVKNYIYLSVKIVFDPPMTSNILESYKALLNTYEWRINVMIDDDEGVYPITWGEENE